MSARINPFFLHGELLSSLLTIVMDDASLSIDKRIYLTDHGFRALSHNEAKIDQTAQHIPLSALSRVLDEDLQNLHPEIQKNYTKALRSFANVLGVPLKLDVNVLKWRAEVEGLGYKTANLDQISIISQEKFGSYHVKVPVYTGISSSHVQATIKERCGLDIGAEWEQIIRKHFPLEDIRKSVLESKKFPKDFLSDTAFFHDRLRRAVENLAAGLEDNGCLNDLFGHPDLDALVQDIKNRKERLMVRSSGREDTKELVNAGGNASVPNVDPNSKDVVLALSEVVASYFGEKSLVQRLGAGDISLFEHTPFTPVLLQRMIGERDPAALPKCGIMFTEDSESAVADRVAESGTSRITVIQSAYGHNEGVVCSLIPVDTYYVNDRIFSIVKPKTYRMMPAEISGELQLVANDSETALKPSLNSQALETLKNFSERLEQFYGMPMDVEFVIDEKEKIIYIVQARPLVHRRYSEVASYVSDLDKLNPKDVFQGTAIISAGGAVRIAAPHHVIVAPNLSEALDRYQACDDPIGIRVIVVGKSAPSTSHWATTFRNEGKTVVHTDQWTLVQSSLDEPDSQILISPQQGLLITLDAASLANQSELHQEGIIAKGWVDYPAAPLFSASREFRPKQKLTLDAIKKLCPALQDPDQWDFFQEHASQFPLDEIFDRLRASKGEDLQIDLAVVLYQFKRVLERHSEFLNLDKDQYKRIDTIQRYALSLAYSINDNGEYETGDANFSRKLFPIHFLHALIYGQAPIEELVDGHSLTTVALRELAAEQKLVKELTEQGISLKNPYSLPLLSLNQLALVPETAKLYRDRVLTLDREERNDRIEGFAKMVISLNKLDMLSPWLNIAFAQNPNLDELQHVFKQQAPFLQELAQKNEILKAINVAAFEKPQSFNTQWHILESLFLRSMQSDEFVRAYYNVDSSTVFAALSLMNKLVDNFDLAIKSMQGSSGYSTEEKLSKFQAMLECYCQLAKSWQKAFVLPPQILLRLVEAERIVYKKILSGKDLSFSPQFDVRAFGSASGAKIEAVKSPITLEDAFSVIHQELLTMLNTLTQRASKKEIPLPPLLKHVTGQLGFTNTTGQEVNTRGVSLFYTKSLRDHGVQYQFHFLTGSDEVTTRVRFSAGNENQRWDRIAQYVGLLKILGKIDVTDVNLTSKGVEFAFQLDQTDNLNSIKGVLSEIENASTSIASYVSVNLNLANAAEVRNEKKLLPKSRTAQEAVEELEKICGLTCLLEFGIIRNILEKLAKIDPKFVETFMKKVWRHKGHDKDITYFNLELPKLLISLGKSHDIFFVRAIELMNSNKTVNLIDGIKLLTILADTANFAISHECMQSMFSALLNPNHRSDSFNKKSLSKSSIELMEVLIYKGIGIEHIQERAASMIASSNKDIRADGLKIQKILLRCQK